VNYVQKRFIIIDGSSLMYRAFYALPLLTTANGEYTNAVYGFATMVTKLIDDLKPDLLVIAFDKGKKTFRNEMFAEYKGTRKPTPTELSAQIPLIHDLAGVFGIKLVEKAGFEADDIIGTLASKAAAAGHESIIVTGDRDALQLVGPNLTVMLTKKGISELECFDDAAIMAKYGLSPNALIDLKGLMGDSSDNIPGVPGVGEKTGLKLLLEYGSLENVLDHIEDVAGKKLKERLTENKELALLSKKLATIIRDMDIPFDEDEYEITPDVAKLKKFCLRYEFKSVAAKIEKLFPEGDGLGFGTVVENLLPTFEKIDDPENLVVIADEVKAAKKIIFYPILIGKMPKIELKGMVLCLEAGLVYVDAALRNWILIMELLSDPNVVKITHDFKPLYHTGQVINGMIFDTMLAAYLLEPTETKYEISTLMEKYLNEFSQPEQSDVIEHAVWASSCIRDLYIPLQERLEKAQLMDLYQNIEAPLLQVLAEMEHNGVYVNRNHLEMMSAEIAVQIDELLKEIHVLAGLEFNVNSPKQLGEVLFERLQLPAAKKTKTGYSTNAEVLEELLPQHPIVAKVLEYRTWTKLKSTYLDGLVVLIDSETNRIHTSFNQMVTATGRLSSSDPNLQNIPVRTEAGKKIRELFEPGVGYQYLMSADYSQIELRVLAHMSEDKNFVEAFTHNQDIHTRTASEVFGIPMDEMTAEIRNKAKAVNFGIVYGISDYGLSRDLHISRKEAAHYIESYFDKCSGVKHFIDRVVEEAHTNGYVTTLFGRRRNLPAINSSNYNQRTLAERMAMNTPIQGTAADIIKKAMIEAYHELKQKKLKSRILLQVHDELVLEVIEEEIEIVSSILKDTMQNTVKLIVPLTIDIKVGVNWARAK
jgi:DNA polymerase-1